jgi:DNA repair protein RadC
MQCNHVYHSRNIWELLSHLKSGAHPKSALIDCLSDIQEKWHKSPNEQACAVYRSRRSGLWEKRNFKTGSARSVNIDLKEIAKRIADGKYNMIVLCHYHPAGSTKPSETDMRTTRIIANLCRSLDVQLHDHFIFGIRPRFSFREAGYL